MLLTFHRKKLEATARTLHPETLIDESVSFSDDEWKQQASNWFREAIQQAEKQLEEFEHVNLKLDKLLERADVIKAQRESAQKQGNSNVQVTTIRIPMKVRTSCRKLIRAA